MTCVVDTIILNRIYNGQQYFPLGPYATIVSIVLNDLRAKMVNHGYNYYTEYNDSTSACCVHGGCDGALQDLGCTACIDFAIIQLKHGATTLSRSNLTRGL